VGGECKEAGGAHTVDSACEDEACDLEAVVTGVLSRGCHKTNWATLGLVEDTFGEIGGVLHVVLGARCDRQGELSLKKEENRLCSDGSEVDYTISSS